MSLDYFERVGGVSEGKGGRLFVAVNSHQLQPKESKTNSNISSTTRGFNKRYFLPQRFIDSGMSETE